MPNSLPAQDPWPNWAPHSQLLKPYLRQQLRTFAERVEGWSPPRLCVRHGLNQARAWETVEVDTHGRVAALTSPHVRVLRWTWELLNENFPGLRVLVQGDGRGRYYARPGHDWISRWLTSSGHHRNSITFSSLVCESIGLGDWDSRTRFIDRDPFNLTLFNLGLTPFPKTPEGEEARRSRLAFQLMRAKEDELERG